MNTKEKIIDLLKKEYSLSPRALIDKIGVSESLVHRHLRALKKEGKIKAFGAPPKVFYALSDSISYISRISTSRIVDDNWLEILPSGEFLYGGLGFDIWCEQRNRDIKASEKDFEKIFKQKQSLKRDGLIDATDKISTTFTLKYLQKVWYVDFYSWEIFGKTLLGKLILYAKQNSDRRLMSEIAQRVQDPIQKLISKESFDSVILVPHSVPRRIDFLSTTVQMMSLNPKPIKLFEKVFSDHVVSQKTLKSKEERNQNAELTLFFTGGDVGKKVLLIDDACGSGATLNIAAKKIKQKNPSAEIYGLTFVGSQKGFDVIAEV